MKLDNNIKWFKTPAQQPQAEAAPAPPAEPAASPAEPAAAPPAAPSDNGEFSAATFAQKKLKEGGDRVLKNISGAIGLEFKDGETSAESVAAYVSEQLKSAQKLEGTAEQLQEAHKAALLERDNSLKQVQEQLKQERLNSGIMKGVIENKLTVSDPTYLKFKIEQDYNFDEDGHIFTKESGGKKPVLNNQGDYAGVSELLKEMSINPSTKSIFEPPASVTGSGAQGGELSDEQVKRKLSDSDFIAKVNKQGLMPELKRAMTMADTKKVIARVKE